TATVTVLPAPSVGVIAGPSTVCIGSIIALTNAVGGGVWSVSPAGPATVSVLGVVAGLSAGVVTVSYTISTSCGPAAATAQVTVVAIPDAGTISGPDHVCTGASVILSNAVAGGVWSSSSA